MEQGFAMISEWATTYWWALAAVGCFRCDSCHQKNDAVDQASHSTGIRRTRSHQCFWRRLGNG